MPTINITEGCAHGCSYCYTQGYSNYPGPNRVVLFDNVPELVRGELQRRRQRFPRVYFSPSSDAFQPVAEVLEVTYQTMSALLVSGISLAFLTKGIVDERFLSLFSTSPECVFAQIGITTMDECICQTFERDASSPTQRLETIERLTQIGVVPMARLDPLIPDVTDTEENLSPLLAALSRRKVTGIAASYIFLRPGFARKLSEQLRVISGSTYKSGAWSWQRLADGVSDVRMISLPDRRRRYRRLRDLAASHGIEVHVCSCKNPDLEISSACQIAGPSPATCSSETMPLFPA